MACSSLRSLMPKMSNPAIPADAAARASRTTSVTESRSSQGAASTFSRSSTALPTMTGRTTRPARSACASARDQTGCSASLPRASVACRMAGWYASAPGKRWPRATISGDGGTSGRPSRARGGLRARREWRRIRRLSFFIPAGPERCRARGRQGEVDLEPGHAAGTGPGRGPARGACTPAEGGPGIGRVRRDEARVAITEQLRARRGYNDAASTFYVNDPMLGNMVPLSYQWFQKKRQSVSYRYMVIYDPKDEALVKSIIGDDWNDAKMRQNFYERTKADAYSQA